MTNELAIRILTGDVLGTSEQTQEAVTMAVRALSQLEPCEDAVSREAVSSWLKQYGQDVLHGKMKFSLMYIWKNLMDLPSAQPERMKGRWISKGYGEYRCSSCRNIVDLDEEILMSIKMFDYCPVCGADMRGEQ